MPLIARQRSRLAVLAVLALVGSLLAVSAVPVAAEADEKPSAEAMYSACVAAATESAEFTDMDGNFAEDAANCLAHYGITTGTEPGVFSPGASITRLQMALFMVRSAGPAGVEIDDPEDQGFGDIDGFTDEIQDGINQAVALGIMSGSDGSFNPTGMVSRQDMATILHGFLAAAQISSLDEDGNVLDAEGEMVTADTPFDDLGTVPFAAYNSINKLYELGIAAGTGDGSSFDPSALVSRGQMAVFVTRALAHTNARPAGISMQTEATGITSDPDHSITVSVRDEDHQPVPDALVDVFTSTSPDEAWDDEGGCVDKHVAGNGPCAIDDDDPATDPDGNTEGATVMLTVEPGTTTVWAWTGEPGDEFDIDEDAYDTAEIDAAKAANGTAVTDDMKDNATRLKFGDTVTYTLQIVNEDGEPVASEGLGATVNALMDDTTVAPNERPDTRTTASVVKTDAAGRIELSYTAEDPDADDDSMGDQITLTLMITATTEDGVFALDVTEATDVDVASGIQVIWTDADAVASHLSISQAVDYHETNDDGVRNTVQGTLVDQYGDPVKNKKVSFWSGPTQNVDNPVAIHGLGGTQADPAAERTTSRSGVATKSYSRDQTPSYTESIDAEYLPIVGCDDREATCTESDDGPAIPADAVSHYWAQSVSGDTATGDVLVVDTDNNSIVLDATVDSVAGPKLVTYKSGDQFRISGGAVTMEAFEKELSAVSDTVAADSVAAVIGDDDDDINSFDITPGT